MPSLMELLGDIGYALDTPGAYTRGLLAARPGERVSGRELFGLEEGTGNEILGLLAEIGLDPLNLLSAGGAGVATAALPLLAMSKLDKAGDVARAGGKLEDILAHNKMVDELLEAGNMPERLARETLFSRKRMVPREGVNPSEIVDALTEAVPEFEKYRGGAQAIDEEILAEMARMQLEAPFHPERMKFEEAVSMLGEDDADRFLKLAGEGGEGWYPHSSPRDVTDIAEQFLATKHAKEDDLERGIAGLRRLGSDRTEVPHLGQVADDEKLSFLASLFDEMVEPVVAEHITRAPEGVIDTVRDLLTPGRNLGLGKAEGIGDQWFGSGVHVGPKGNPLPEYLEGLAGDEGARVLEGLVHMKNPVVIPHSRYYDEAGLQKFIKENPDLFDVPDEHYDKVFGDEGLSRFGDEGYDEGAEAWEAALDKDAYDALGEEFGLDPDAFQSMKAGPNAPRGEFTPEIASDIVRSSGYDAVIPASRDMWIDELFEPANAEKYKEFREVVLSDPAFWHEINLMYPEEASRYLGPHEEFTGSSALKSAGFSDPRAGDPLHGQLFLPGDVVPEKIPVPDAPVPPADIQKALLVAIGVGGMNEVLKSMEKNREVAA